MNYSQVLAWLFSQVPNYQKTGANAYKPGLDTIRSLLAEMGNPHANLKTIHVAGTNGKGSTSHILASILQENGYKVGLFTSPHIKDFRERVKINGELVSEQEVTDFFSKYQDVIIKHKASFFEITTAFAFTVFHQNKCDIAIIETGLGGRLDSTNVILPEVSVITNIDIDHTALLGNTIEAIALEKAGIIKEGVPVVVGETTLASQAVFMQKAQELNASIVFADENAEKVYETDLFGAYQQNNIHTALAAIQALRFKGWVLSDDKIKNALLNVKKNTALQGRLQQINMNPRIFIDAAHNLAGIKRLLIEAEQMGFDALRIVYGASNDKDLENIFKIFPKSANYYFSEFDSERSAKIETLKQLAGFNSLIFKTFDSPVLALENAKAAAGLNDLIIVCGSFYLIEKII